MKDKGFIQIHRTTTQLYELGMIRTDLVTNPHFSLFFDPLILDRAHQDEDKAKHEPFELDSSCVGDLIWERYSAVFNGQPESDWPKVDVRIDEKSAKLIYDYGLYRLITDTSQQHFRAYLQSINSPSSVSHEEMKESQSECFHTHDTTDDTADTFADFGDDEPCSRRSKTKTPARDEFLVTLAKIYPDNESQVDYETTHNSALRLYQWDKLLAATHTRYDDDCIEYAATIACYGEIITRLHNKSENRVPAELLDFVTCFLEIDQITGLNYALSFADPRIEDKSYRTIKKHCDFDPYGFGFYTDHLLDNDDDAKEVIKSAGSRLYGYMMKKSDNLNRIRQLLAPLQSDAEQTADTPYTKVKSIADLTKKICLDSAQPHDSQQGMVTQSIADKVREFGLDGVLSAMDQSNHIPFVDFLVILLLQRDNNQIRRPLFLSHIFDDADFVGKIATKLIDLAPTKPASPDAYDKDLSICKKIFSKSYQNTMQCIEMLFLAKDPGFTKSIFWAEVVRQLKGKLDAQPDPSIGHIRLLQHAINQGGCGLVTHLRARAHNELSDVNEPEALDTFLQSLVAVQRFSATIWDRICVYLHRCMIGLTLLLDTLGLMGVCRYAYDGISKMMQIASDITVSTIPAMTLCKPAKVKRRSSVGWFFYQTGDAKLKQCIERINDMTKIEVVAKEAKKAGM